MLTYVLFGVMALVVLIISTQLFVSGASTVATALKASPVLIGAVILGCGTGLPELAITFFGSHESPFRQLFRTDSTANPEVLAVVLVLLILVLAAPTLFPDRFAKHSPFVMAATIGFSALLRGSLDRIEAFAMLAGFIVGIGAIIYTEQRQAYDPFAPLIEDKYEVYGGCYVDAPIMSDTQKGWIKVFVGLLGTAIGAQLMAYSANAILEAANATPLLRNLVFVGIASLLPHIVVAVQAIRQHHEGLAVGNLIGSNLFNNLVIGGSLALIRPYQLQANFTIGLFGIVLATAALTWVLLHTTEDEVSRWQGVMMLAAYVVLVGCVSLDL